MATDKNSNHSNNQREAPLTERRKDSDVHYSEYPGTRRDNTVSNTLPPPPIRKDNDNGNDDE